MKAAISVELLSFLDTNRIPYSLVTETGRDGAPVEDRKRQQLEAVKRWFYHDWRRIEPKLRTSIVEGISVFLSLFDDNPSVKYTFARPRNSSIPNSIRITATEFLCPPSVKCWNRARCAPSTSRFPSTPAWRVRSAR